MGTIMAGAGILKSGFELAGALKNKGAVNQELKTAKAKFQNSRNRYENFTFTNPWEQLENTAEDLTVNTQAAEFQAMNADQALAASLETMRETGGGASSAQAIANAALMSQQGISSSLAQQEQSNSMLRAQQAAANQKLVAQGDEDIQTQRLEQTQGVLNMNAARMEAANAAKSANQSQIAGSMTSLASGLGGLAGSSGLLGKAKGLLGGKAQGLLGKLKDPTKGLISNVQSGFNDGNFSGMIGNGMTGVNSNFNLPGGDFANKLPYTTFGG
jgi:hypothetical protein